MACLCLGTATPTFVAVIWNYAPWGSDPVSVFCDLLHSVGGMTTVQIRRSDREPQLIPSRLEPTLTFPPRFATAQMRVWAPIPIVCARYVCSLRRGRTSAIRVLTLDPVGAGYPRCGHCNLILLCTEHHFRDSPLARLKRCHSHKRCGVGNRYFGMATYGASI